MRARALRIGRRAADRSRLTGVTGPAPAFRAARRVRRPSGPRACESGVVVSLLARLPRRGRTAARPQAASARLAGGGRDRSRSRRRAGRPRVWPSSSSRPSTRPAACPSAARPRWPASCGCSPRAGSSSSASGPLVLAPLLLTLGDRLGTVARGPRRRARPGPAPARGRGRAPRASSSACTLLVSLLLGARLDATDGGSGCSGRPRRARRARAAVPSGWGVGRESGVLDARARPAARRPPPAAARRARRAAHRAGAVHRRRRGRAGLRRPGLRRAVAVPGRRGRRGRSACSGSALLLLPNAAAAGARPRGRARASSSAPARSSRCTG